MLKILKWLLYGIGALIAVLVLAVIAIVLLVDPNQFRDEIAAEVKKRTGRELVIEGDIELSVFPWLGLELGSTRLSDAPGFGDQPFVSFERAALAVEIMPLLEKRLVLDTIELERPRIRLLRNEKGQANWEELTERLASDQPAEQAEPEPAKEGAGGPPVTLDRLGGFKLTEAVVIYEDRQAGARYELNPLTVTIDEPALGRPSPVQAQFAVRGSGLPELSGQFGAKVLLDEAFEQLAVSGLQLDISARGEAVPGGSQQARLTGELAGNLKSGQYQLSQLALQAAGLTLNAVAELTLAEAGPRASAKVSIPAFNARELLQKLGQPVPETADPKALTAVAAEMQAAWADEVLNLSGLALRVDDTNLKGEARLGPFDPLTGSFKLTVDSINLDRYLPPPTEAPEGAPAPQPQPQPQPQPGEPAGELPLEPLRKLRLNGVAQVGKVILKNMTLSDLNVQLRAHDGDIRLNPLTAKLYQGSYSGNVRLDARTDDPRISVDEHLSGVQSEPLLTDLLGESKISGVASVHFQAAMEGAGMDEWLSSIDGKGNFEFKNGAIKDFNLAQMIREAKARLRGEKLAEEGPRSTDFTAITGSMNIQDGLVSNPDLLAESPLFRVTGKGSAHLVSQELDYLLTVNIVGTSQGQGGKDLEDLKRVPIPLRIGGSFSEPSFKLDLAEAVRQAAGERVERQVEEKKQELETKAEKEVERAQERLENKAKDELQRLFKR